MKSPRVALSAIVAIALMTLTACGSGGSAKGDSSSGQELTVATVQAWAGFNPYVPDQGTSIGLAIANAMYPSAFNVQPDQTATLNEDLLESATLTSQDPQTVEYKINPDAQWSDGTPITVDDFVYLWQHLNGSNEKLLVTAAIGYKQIKSIEADGDPKTVKVVFSSPFADWQSLFATLLPAHYMKTLGDDVAAWNTGLVSKAAPSGGPYSMVKNQDGEYVQLAANPKWYGESPTVKELTVRYFGDDQAAVQALASGEVNFTLNLKATRALIGQVKAVANAKVDVVPTSNQQFLNTQFDSKTVGDLAVRKAIATVVDPEKLAKTLFGDDVSDLLTTNHIFAPTSPHYVDNRPAGFGSGDAAAASAILEQAGYVKGSDGVYAKGGTRLELRFVVRSEDQVAKQFAVVLQDDLKTIGIKLDINPVGSADYFPTLGKGEFDLGLGNYPASAFPVSWYGGLYPCKAGYNFARVCDKEVDSAYYQAYGTLDADEQAELVNKVDQLLWAEVANVPLFEVPQLVVRSASVKGVDPLLPKEYQLLAASHWSVG